MKRWILTAAVLLLVFGTIAAATTRVSDFRWNSTKLLQRNGDLHNWAQWVEGAVAGTEAGTGDIYYVDSNVTATGAGTSWDTAMTTLAGAIALCTANNGDIIYVAQGHDESLAASVAVNIAGITIIGCGNGDDRPEYLYTDTDGALTVSVANVTITGLRFKPGISAVVTAVSLAATADNFTLADCEFVEPGTATFEFYDMVTLASGTDYCTIDGNKFVSTVSTTGCNQAINADAGIVNRLIITNNDFQGNFAIAAIHSSRANTNCVIGWNDVYQVAAGQYAIEFTAAATGMAIDNVMWTDAVGTCFDPGSLACSNNKAINTIDLSAITIPALPAIGTVTAGSADDILKKLYYGTDGTGAYPATLANDSALAMLLAKGSTATASTYSNTTDSLEALADHVQTLITTAAGTDVYPSGVTSDSIIAMILSKSGTAAASSYNNTTDSLEALGDALIAVQADTNANDTESEVADLGSTLVDNIVAAIDANGIDINKIDSATLATAPTAASLASFIASGGVALGTQLASSKSLVDAIGTNGTTVADTATGVAGMIGVNDADNAMDTSTVVANGDGSVYERLEYAQGMKEKCISKTITTIANGANNLFAVTGGPIKITEIVTYVTTTQIASEGCLVGYNIDPTTPATDTAFGTDGTAFECNAAAVGSALIWDGVLAADLTKATNGVAVLAGTDVSYGLLCPIGMVELTAAHDGTCAGEFTVYMRYMPLSPLSVVTAQ